MVTSFECNPMDYGRMCLEPQAPPPPPHPPQTAGDYLHLSAPPLPQHQHYAGALHHHHQPLSYSYATNSNFNYYHYESSPIQSSPGLQDPYASYGGYSHAAPSFRYADEGPSTMSVGGTVDGVYGYVGEDQATLAAKEAIRQYGAHPISYTAAQPRNNSDGLEPTVPQYSNPHDQNPVKGPKSSIVKKKILKKTTKVVHSAYCAVCKVDCNSQETLKSHKQGKKHKKNLQKLKDSITPKLTKAETVAPAGALEVAADDEETLKCKKTKSKMTIGQEDEVDLETKRKRILEAGAPADEVRVCTICSVVVNSQKVYEYHLEGQKHAAMVEKLQETEVSL